MRDRRHKLVGGVVQVIALVVILSVMAGVVVSMADMVQKLF